MTTHWFNPNPMLWLNDPTVGPMYRMWAELYSTQLDSRLASLG